MELDLSSFKSIRAFAATFTAQHKSLDSLVLNAGVMMPPFTLTAEGLEMQIGTNHFGHQLLTSLLLPALEQHTHDQSATVVAVSSAAHYDTYPEGVRLTLESLNDEATYIRPKAYGQSKLANVLFAQELAVRVTLS
jgi:NAD(P)-dependent dehydrogenase (short-subunit alcohol dehydrogenase family)